MNTQNSYALFLLFSVLCQENTIMAGPWVWGIRALSFTGSLWLHGRWGDLTTFRFGPQCHRTAPVWSKFKWSFIHLIFQEISLSLIDNFCVFKWCRWDTLYLLINLTTFYYYCFWLVFDMQFCRIQTVYNIIIIIS